MALVSSVALTLALVGCAGPGSLGEADGFVRIDGSSTVFPITEAVAEEHGRRHPLVRVTVGISGTGGGFEKFSLGEIDINDASRPIKSSEVATTADRGVDFVELPIALDGLTIVVHPENDFVDYLTLEELSALWRVNSEVQTWRDLRREWPERPISLYAPGTDSGSFDYFTQAVNGRAGSCRSDFVATEDDNVIVQGVAGDVDALGFFGYAYYRENEERLRAVPIDSGRGPVTPSAVTIRDGSYAPLTRPLLIYVSLAAADRVEVANFVEFYLDFASELTTEIGYVPLPDRLYEVARERFVDRRVGSLLEESRAEDWTTLHQTLMRALSATGVEG